VQAESSDEDEDEEEQSRKNTDAQIPTWRPVRLLTEAWN